MTEPWASADAIDEHLSVTTGSVYGWIASKSMPAHRDGRPWKFEIIGGGAWVRGGCAADTFDEGAGR